MSSFICSILIMSISLWTTLSVSLLHRSHAMTLTASCQGIIITIIIITIIINLFISSTAQKGSPRKRGISSPRWSFVENFNAVQRLWIFFDTCRFHHDDFQHSQMYVTLKLAIGAFRHGNLNRQPLNWEAIQGQIKSYLIIKKSRVFVRGLPRVNQAPMEKIAASEIVVV